MINTLKEIYLNIPIVRELRLLRRQVKYLHEAVAPAIDRIDRSTSSALRLQQQACRHELLSQDRYRDPKRLSLYEAKIHSQNGEDGIIQEIFRRIGTTNQAFLEIGVGNGLENNTAFLLTRGWRGCWVDCDPSGIAAIRENMGSRLSDGRLKLVDLAVTMENVAPALHDNGVPEDIDLMSIDVDCNTYWIWAGLANMRARVVVVEYNPVFPASTHWVVRYDPQATWDASSFYYGASLKALETLGFRLGYSLVGCNLTGNNAFFVRSELCQDLFRDPFSSETHYEPHRGSIWEEPITYPRGYSGLI
jgi:hypothetical protein